MGAMQPKVLDAKIVCLIQGSKEWLATRKQFITATEIGMVTDPARWETYERQKKNDRNFQSKAMARGNRLEPVAREALTKKTGIAYFPAVFVSDSERLLASLDGLALGRRATCEIKCPEKGKESDLWKKIEQGRLPKGHWQQMQLGMLLSGAPVCHYWVYDEISGEGLYREIRPDEQYFNLILAQSKAYWNAKANNAIGPSNVHYASDADSLEVAARYEKVVNDLKYLEKMKESLAGQLEDKFPEGAERLIAGNLQIDRKPACGTIDYKAIVDATMPDLDKDKYRKAPAKSEKITVKIVEGNKAA
jgi:putative phage-type endonuclease